MTDMKLTMQHVEAWRRKPDILASGSTRDGKHKQFMINADGWAYVYINNVLIATFTELQQAIANYNDL